MLFRSIAHLDHHNSGMACAESESDWESMLCWTAAFFKLWFAIGQASWKRTAECDGQVAKVEQAMGQPAATIK